MGKKNPILAAFFSVIIAGFGHFYIDRFPKGVFFLALEALTTYYAYFYAREIGFILNIFISIWAAVDAYTIAKQIEPLKTEGPEIYI
ncbi:MAG: hypothetical protein ABH851_04550 [Methanobacteriota archaeon]